MPSATDHRYWAIEANSRVWALLESPTRTADQASEMLNAAHASLWHWQNAGGTIVNHQRGEWLIARVCCELGFVDSALRQLAATQALTLQGRDRLADFDFAFERALTARVLALVGVRDDALVAYAAAQSFGHALSDPEDRAVFFAQLEAEPWFGLARPS